MTKACTRCSVEKELASFRTLKSGNLDPYCKKCRTALTRIWRQKNPEKSAAIKKAELERAWAAGRKNQATRNPEQSLAQAKAKSRVWLTANRDRLAAQRRAAYHADIDSRRARGRNEAQRRIARRLGATTEIFNRSDVLDHYAKEGWTTCVYCGGPYQHDDHVVPLARGGSHSVENLVPSCARCNQSKGCRTLASWLGFEQRSNG